MDHSHRGDNPKAPSPGLWLAVGLLVFGMAGPVSAQDSGETQEAEEDGDPSDLGVEPEDVLPEDGEPEETEPEADQSSTVELTDEQKRLNNKAIDAMTGESPGPAIRYLKAALMVGPKGNLLYMALGRAYQLDGKCGEATDIFDMAAEAPQVESVPREQVMARIEKYRGDLESTCPGRLVVECSPESVEVTVGDTSVTCGEAIDLPPGQYTVEGRFQDFPEKKKTVEIVSMKTETVEIAFELGSAAETAKGDVAGAVATAQSEHMEAYRREEARRERERLASEGTRVAGEVARKAESMLGSETGTQDRQETGGVDVGKQLGRKPNQREPTIADRLGGEFRARLPLGMYFVQLQDGDTSGGLHYGGSVIASIGLDVPPSWLLENRMQFDWLQAISGNTDDDGMDLDTWRFQNDLRWWWNTVGVGLFLDYRHQGLKIGNSRGEADTRTINTTSAGPSLVISSKPPFAEDGHFRIYGRWAPLIQGEDDYYQLGVNLAGTYGEVSVEYDRLTGAHSPGQAFRRGETVTLYVGARLTL